MDTNSTVTATASPKSLGVALVLALLLGPIGLLYATVMGGVVLLVADLIALFVFLAAAPVGILLFVAVQIAAVIWAIKALTSQNAELLGQLPPGVATALAKLGLVTVGESERKAVTFGDPEAATGGLLWSIVSVVLIFALWSLAVRLELASPIFMPPPTEVLGQFITVATDGFRGFTLWEHLGISLYRLLVGFFFGCLLGIPIGFAMGLSKIMRGFFDPIVEFMRPIPPLALIPLSIIWLGIGNASKIFLLFLAALWIMVLAARSGVQSIRISKIHAAYTLGASKQQLLLKVVLPNALPEIFTGMRVAMGVCWGTLVAAELVGAEAGIGFMITVAGKYLETGLVFVGIIIIGIVGAAIDVAMRKAEARMIPWKGKA
ncbi:MAG: ABC transporter permease subunit [Gammaproteobacteria bacterium]|nr:ABC transporter permease subunit [Gammaproteobacteria bacterium]